MPRANIVPWDRSGHGKGRGAPRIEVPPVEESPAGMPAPQPDTSPVGKPPYAVGSAEAREAARRGGAAGKGRTALADDPITLGDYAKQAEAFRRAELTHLRQNVGGGKVSPGARMLVKLAARLSAAALKAFDAGRDADGNKFTEGARQALLAAHAKCAKEAAPQAGSSDIDRLRDEVLGKGGSR